MHLINLFGNSGGFDLILNIISKATDANISDGNDDNSNTDSLDLNILGTLA